MLCQRFILERQWKLDISLTCYLYKDMAANLHLNNDLTSVCHWKMPEAEGITKWLSTIKTPYQFNKCFTQYGPTNGSHKPHSGRCMGSRTWWLKWMNNYPLNTWRNNNVAITSKRRHFDVITSKWRRVDVITTSSLRNVSAGYIWRSIACGINGHSRLQLGLTDIIQQAWHLVNWYQNCLVGVA